MNNTVRLTECLNGVTKTKEYSGNLNKVNYFAKKDLEEMIQLEENGYTFIIDLYGVLFPSVKAALKHLKSNEVEDTYQDMRSMERRPTDR